ncbi:MAG: hypothetical protein GY850_14130 [bacterium]|nr:hypothetical protein [bacterium]
MYVNGKYLILCLIITGLVLSGVKHVCAWELKPSAPLLKGPSKSNVDRQQPVPSLDDIRKQIKAKGYDFSVGETRPYRLARDNGIRLHGQNMQTMDLGRLRKIKAKNLPERFDWRDRGMVTPVKDQHPCGTCWAFATVAEMESKVLINEGIEYDFSEQHLTSCEYWTTSGRSGNCFPGGTPQRATNLFTKKGLVLETCSPYEAIEDVACEVSCAAVKKVTGWRIIANDVETIKAVISEYGPITTGMDGADLTLNAYTGGVYEHEGQGLINHLVLLVGWDDSLGDHGAWIVKNSWGTDWGMDGYFYIAYGSSDIGILTSYFSSYEDNNPDESVLYYDEAGFFAYNEAGTYVGFSSIGNGTQSAWCASVFNTDGRGELQAVDFWTTSDSGYYQIRIYEHIKNGRMGRLLAMQRGRFDNMGYYSVPLKKAVALEEGDDFVVAVRFMTPGFKYPVGVDSIGPVESGKCYLSSDGRTWIPMGEGTRYNYDLTLRAVIRYAGSAAPD